MEIPTSAKLPALADEIVSYRFPDALDMEVVRHSDQCYTCTLMDMDYRHYTFRLHLSLDGRWSLAPVSGFEENVTFWLSVRSAT